MRDVPDQHLMFETQELPANDLPASTVPLPVSPSQPIHLLDRLSAIFKHRRVAATAFVLVVTVMMIQTYSTVPIFQAASRVLIQDERTAQVSESERQRPRVLAGRRSVLQDAVQHPPEPRARATRRRTPRCRAQSGLRRRPPSPRSDFPDPAGARRCQRLGALAGLEA